MNEWELWGRPLARSKMWRRDGSSGRRPEPTERTPAQNPFEGTDVVREGLANKTDFKQWSRRYKLAAGEEDDRFKALLQWTDHRPGGPAALSAPKCPGTKSTQVCS